LRSKDLQLLSNDTLKPFVKDLQKRGFTASASLHSFKEVENLPCRLDYVFLSPIFQSISKQDYPSAFTKDELVNFFQQRKSKTSIVALGGVREENLKELQQIGFVGIALLGSIWQ
jgi:thiamine-phosphate pyrophosphorylase